MRYREIATPSNREPLGPFSRERLEAAGFRCGFVDDARRAATPYAIDCIGLCEDHLPYPEYVSELQRRREWCRNECVGDHEIEPIRDERMRLVGRRFRFATVEDATLFRFTFNAVLSWQPT